MANGIRIHRRPGGAFAVAVTMLVLGFLLQSNAAGQQKATSTKDQLVGT